MTPAEAMLSEKFTRLQPTLTEAGRRRWVATDALARGRPRSRTRRGEPARPCDRVFPHTTIHAGIKEIQNPELAARPLGPARSRRAGGGRKSLPAKSPELLPALHELVSPGTRGAPPKPAARDQQKHRQTGAAGLTARGHPVSAGTVAALLAREGSSLQSWRQTREGSAHPDRDAQILHLDAPVREHLAAGLPLISVDTKKKEPVGDFSPKGRERQTRGKHLTVRGHAFVDNAPGQAAPQGLSEVAANEGWVSVGADHDTAAFALESIRRWWRQMGRPLYS